MIKDNLANVKRRIKEASERAGREPGEVKLIVVTKEAEIDRIREVIEAGVSDIGENRVKEALSKKKLLDAHVLTWHMIGHLQSNKAKDAVRIFSVIHSIDSIKSLHIIDREAKKEGKSQDVLAEVNVSGEESKFGLKPDTLKEFLEEAKHLKNVKVLGLMTMTPFSDNPESARPHFKKLKKLAEENNLRELSMGMTQDFEVAIEEGATMVRLGSAIFRGNKYLVARS